MKEARSIPIEHIKFGFLFLFRMNKYKPVWLLVIQGNSLHARGTPPFNRHGQSFHLLHLVIGLNLIFKGNVVRKAGEVPRIRILKK